jgi:hypothetical protein
MHAWRRPRPRAATRTGAQGAQHAQTRHFTRFFTHPCAAPPEARGASNRWSGVVRGTKVVGKSHARACRRRFPAPHPFDLNVPEGGRWGGAGLRRLLLNRRLNPFLGGVLGECGRAQRLESRCHFILKNDPMSLFGFCLPSWTIRTSPSQ